MKKRDDEKERKSGGQRVWQIPKEATRGMELYGVASYHPTKTICSGQQVCGMCG
jgi:hypothetical protein